MDEYSEVELQRQVFEALEGVFWHTGLIHSGVEFHTSE